MAKRPFASLEKIREIAEIHPTPFHIYDEAGIRKTARDLLSAFSWNKGFKEFFAVKALPNPVILNILKEEGCGVDCSSYTELLLAKAVGFKGSEVMFSSNVTPKEDYLLARELGAYINLDDASDADIVTDLFPLPKTMCLRYNPGGTFAIGNTIMDNPQDAKYGMTEEQMVEAIKKLMGRGVKHFGIHAFLSSNTLTDYYYPILAEMMFLLAVRVKKATGADISFINLSGGIGIPYMPEDEKVDIFHVGRKVKEAYESILVPEGMEPSIFAELGRFMTGPHGALVTRVVHEKKIYKDYLGVDACAADLMRPAMYGAYHHITVLGKEDEAPANKYDVTGGLCENNDKFAIDRMLPKTEIGDLLFIHDTGAHGFSMGYNYNGKLRSAEILLKEDGSFRLIRRAETPDDYFSTLDILCGEY
ncbi:MAG: diaminopimelate decarboxylase [Clostridia bacterium]|nr:diaminopimelate decarboxylase [Clostridia bacterium]MBQ5956500.1 diaminopimelate decarboxylase [Clostridia bacterium]